MIENILKLLEHDDHYCEVDYDKEGYRICSRCTGKILGLVFGLPFSIFLLMATARQFSFNTVFLTSWLFALPLIVDWGLTKLTIWKSNNIIRSSTGFLFGIGLSIYLIILPLPFNFVISFTLKILSLMFFKGIVFFSIKYLQSRKNNISLTSLFYKDSERKLRDLPTDNYGIEPSMTTVFAIVFCCICCYYLLTGKDAMEEGCFIATAAYGSPMEKEVEYLRNWRDDRLKKSALGRFFINAYYLISPPFALIISKFKILRLFSRKALKPVIKLIKTRYSP